MTSSKALASSNGQATVEAVMALIVVLVTSLLGVTLLLHGMCALIATRRASHNSRFIATGGQVEHCKRRSVDTLQSLFVFREVAVKTLILRDIIRTEISADIPGPYDLHVSYDLEPSEYKRVSP